MDTRVGKDQGQKSKMGIDLSRYTLFQKEKIKHCALLPYQGYCNTNYLAITENTRYLIRKLQPNSLDRAFEYRVQQHAHRKKIGAEPFHYDAENYLIISDFLDGEHKSKLTPREIRTVAETLRKLHRINLRKERYRLKKDFKPGQTKALKALKKLQKEPKDHVLTHHDLNPRNILFHKQRVKFIDWEYTGINDRYFDLATIAAEFKLTAREERYFLRSYFRNNAGFNLKKLHLYKELYTILCSLWFKNFDAKKN
ncbi:MAG: choline/ethanolamine kinase family protein [Sulfurimonas sp.]